MNLTAAYFPGAGGTGGRHPDPDHGRGGYDEHRRSDGQAPAPYPAYGEPFPDGIGGARSNGAGHVLLDPDVVAGARERARDAVATAAPGVPAFNAVGDLPVGVYSTTWGDFAARFNTTPRRADLLAQLRPALDALGRAGVTQAIVGGSFVTAKPAPGDIDLAFLANGSTGVADAQQALVRLGDAAAEVHAYPADSLLVEAPTLPGVRPGINVLEFFQRSREGRDRGVVVLPTALVPSA